VYGTYTDKEPGDEANPVLHTEGSGVVIIPNVGGQMVVGIN
jgi:hypothetical protein